MRLHPLKQQNKELCEKKWLKKAIALSVIFAFTAQNSGFCSETVKAIVSGKEN